MLGAAENGAPRELGTREMSQILRTAAWERRRSNINGRFKNMFKGDFT